jgi:UTP:GlnB (protein PII) uridylyltransferase
MTAAANINANNLVIPSVDLAALWVATPCTKMWQRRAVDGLLQKYWDFNKFIAHARRAWPLPIQEFRQDLGQNLLALPDLVG